MSLELTSIGTSRFNYAALMPTHYLPFPPPSSCCISPNYTPDMRAVSPLTMTSWPGDFRLACRATFASDPTCNLLSYLWCSVQQSPVPPPYPPTPLHPWTSLVNVATCTKFAHATNELEVVACLRFPQGDAAPNANQFAASACVAMTHAPSAPSHTPLP